MSNFLKFGIPFLLIFGVMSFFLSGTIGEVSFRQKDAAAYVMMARSFRGLAGSRELTALLDEVSTLNKEGRLKGTFAVWYEANPDVLQDTLSIKVGVILEPTISADQAAANRPDSLFTVIGFPASTRIEAIVDTRELFSPGPSEVNKRLEVYAQENRLELAPAILEQYFPDGRVVTSREVK